MEYFYSLILLYKYEILLPIAFFEGPIITFFSGFLISIGVFSFLPTFIILLLGNLIPDLGYYYLGRYGTNFKYYKKHQHKIEHLEKLFHHHLIKTIIFGKLSMFFSVPVLIAGGAAKIPVLRYFRVSALVDMAIISTLLLVGYLAGESYSMYSKYLDYFAAGFTILIIIVVIALRFLAKKASKEIEKLEKE